MARQRDFAAEYARRIAKGRVAGKTRQQARGHVVREHVRRAERERAKRGISSQEETSIRRWALNRQVIQHNRDLDPDAIIEWVREHDFSEFQAFRDKWWAVHRQYKREVREGTWESRGLAYLDQMFGRWSPPPADDIGWFYYH
jgi:hypothetical protein